MLNHTTHPLSYVAHAADRRRVDDTLHPGAERLHRRGVLTGDVEAVIGEEDLAATRIRQDIVIADLVGEGFELGLYICIEVIKGLFLFVGE